MTEPGSLCIVIGMVAGVILLVLISLLLVRPWVKAVLSGCPIPLLTILGMRLRGNPPGLLIEAYIALIKSGIETRMDIVEVVYIANKTKARSADALVSLVREQLEKEKKTV